MGSAVKREVLSKYDSPSLSSLGHTNRDQHTLKVKVPHVCFGPHFGTFASLFLHLALLHFGLISAIHAPFPYLSSLVSISLCYWLHILCIPSSYLWPMIPALISYISSLLCCMYSLFRKSTKATHMLLHISSRPYSVPTFSDSYRRPFQNPVTLRVRGCNARMLKPSHVSLGSLDRAKTSVSSVDLSICTRLNKYPLGVALRLTWSEAAKKERLPNLAYKWLVTKPGIYSYQSEK